ncbi:hypothetical protein [Vitreimonas sp.]|jgi:hypothetical protein|uniref:hypothetical protein n=1 Tax=Vitreimonas sp. TaxID=3069702 RepID=UPI002EDB8A80
MWRAAVAIVGLAACSPDVPSAPSPSTPEVEQPQAEQWPANFEWLTGAGGDGRAWLYFGPDESDNIYVHFECRPNDGELNAEAFDFQGEGTRLVLSSERVRNEFEATPHRNEDIYSGVKAEARVPLSAPVLQEFRRTGILAAGDPATIFRPATSEELGRIESFFVRCAGD